MSKTIDQQLDSLKVEVDAACAKMDSLRAEISELRREKKALLDALQNLYDASPISSESDSLNQAQIQAEKVLGL